MLQFLKKIINISQKVLIVLAVYFIVFFLFVSFTSKNKSKTTLDPIKKNRQQIYKIINDPKLQTTTKGKITIQVYKSIMCSLVGEACTNNPQDGDKNFNHSLFGQGAKLLSATYINPPASGIYWAYSGLAKSGFIPKIYASGIGFSSISPLSNIWNAFRNISYMILVVIIITIGFMIMFRMKLNPQTVISVENSLPRIIFSLILITFSFAIAGFLIDLMYVFIILIISIIGPHTGKPVDDLKLRYLQAGVKEIFWSLTGKDLLSKGSLLGISNALLYSIPELNWIIRIIGSALGVTLLFPTLNKTVGWIISQLSSIEFGAELIGKISSFGLFKGLVGGTAKSALMGIALVIGTIMIFPFILAGIIFLTLVFIFFRILFLLLSSYVKIILLIIISPLYLMLEAIPGIPAFSSWFKNLLTEIITFPLVIAIFLMSAVIINSASSGDIGRFPFLFSLQPEHFSFLIGAWILFMTPDLVKLAKQLILPKPLPLQAGIGAFFSGTSTGIQTGLGEVSKFATLAPYYSPLGGLLSKIPGFDFNSNSPNKPKKIFKT